MEKYIFERGQKISNWEKCNCGNLSEMYCICEGIYDTRIHDPEANDWAKSHYKVLRCPSCQQILILRYVTGDTDLSDDSFEQKSYEEYTREVLYSPSKQRHYSIPAAIIEIIAQAEKVAPISPRATFVLCRAVLEEICRERNIAEKKINSKGEEEHLDLKARINLLLGQNKLPRELREVMHGIRELGNRTVHGSQVFLAKEITLSEAEVLINLTDYILDQLYVDKARIQDIQKDVALLKDKVPDIGSESAK